MNLVAVYGKFIISTVNQYNLVWSWSMLTTETFFKRYVVTKRGKPISKRRKFGIFSSKSSEVLKLYMIVRFYTEI